MDIKTIFTYIFRYGSLALIGLAVIIPLFWGGYLFYRRVLHGSVKLTFRQAAAIILLAGWLIVVIGLTALSRGANFTGYINLSLFSGYVNAWNKWSYRELQLIIFNMLMFAPLGFLLPLVSGKTQKMSVVFIISLTLTVLIELVQLLSGKGIFELDDIMHNTAGSLFGYFLIMAILDIIERKRIRLMPLLKASALPLLYVLLISAAVLAYERQPYGNLPFLPAQKQNMKRINVIKEAPLTDETFTVSVYRNLQANDLSRIEELIQSVERLTGESFDRSFRVDNNVRMYAGISSGIQLTVFTESGEWTYTTWEQDRAILDDNEAENRRQEMENWMGSFKSEPSGLIFSQQDGGTLRWDAPDHDRFRGRSDFVLGSVMAEYDASGTLAQLNWFLKYNSYCGEVETVSPLTAFRQILQGNFYQYVPFEKNDRLVIEDCVMDYEYDTKGFLRPVYRFSGYVNEPENIWQATVSAMK
ncbi:MAG: VanZ family protein [Erysipelotrichaceae bacterium]|nr:VanZ family protein [Erysipelotrichaceae bacterium]